jgi:putative tryptophan/tyrosine transport system substrate-binding protein
MAIRIRRREFVATLGSAALWPLTARAEQPERRIGVLMGYAESDREGQAFLAAFREELKKLGWAEGRNVGIDARWAAPNDTESRLQSAKELVSLHPDLVLSHGTPSTTALMQQSRTLPILFVNVSDPIGSGFVTSFARPGSNATGFVTMEPTMAGKWVELLKEIAPTVTRCVLLFNPTTAPYAEYFLNPFKAAAASFAIDAGAARVRDPAELETVIVAQTREPNGGLVVMPDTFLSTHRAKITALASQYRLPAVYPFRFYAAGGGLVSYGGDSLDIFRRAAAYADRILRGEKPRELPVQAPVKFELVINRKTAISMGLTIPTSLMVAATEVIE